jgi:hypothetical protein
MSNGFQNFQQQKHEMQHTLMLNPFILNVFMLIESRTFVV